MPLFRAHFFAAIGSLLPVCEDSGLVPRLRTFVCRTAILVSRGNGFVYFAGLGISQAGWDVFSMDVVSRLRDFFLAIFCGAVGDIFFFVEAGFN